MAEKERPILFTTSLVPEILADRKTKTRRILRPQLPDEPTRETGKRWGMVDGAFYYCGVRCPYYGAPGDRLWVRETWQAAGAFAHLGTGRVQYRADYPDGKNPHGLAWKPSIHMPRWASRITLEVTGVRVERLREITEDDIIAEGVGVDAFLTEKQRRDLFFAKWDSLHGAGAAETNPWVWVIDFRRFNAR
jgi:hypothetical protein